MCLKIFFKKKKGLKFPFRKEESSLLGVVYRPIVRVHFWSSKGKYWLEVLMIADTGADYTLLPRYLAEDLQIDLKTECQAFTTFGIGGSQKVFLLPSIKIRLGEWERKIPVGFLDKNTVPPLLGRHKALEKFNTLFAKRQFVEFTL